MADIRERWDALYRELRDVRLTEYVLRARLIRETVGLHPADRPAEPPPVLCPAHPFLPPHLASQHNW